MSDVRSDIIEEWKNLKVDVIGILNSIKNYDGFDNCNFLTNVNNLKSNIDSLVDITEIWMNQQEIK